MLLCDHISDWEVSLRTSEIFTAQANALERALLVPQQPRISKLQLFS